MIQITEHAIYQKGLIIKDSQIHGLQHLKNVERFGLIMANRNGADKMLVSLFAYLHDARRHTDNDDPDHGKRAALLLDELLEEDVFTLSKIQRMNLAHALAWHNSFEAKSHDITVQTCWDADRLDLWRAGIEPNPKFMFTDVGRSSEMIEYAKSLHHCI
jgi:uncharacterized protein